MTYNSQEISIQDGAPYFLYEFVINEITYRYTDYPSIVNWGAYEWVPFPIKHTEVKQSSELSKNSMKVTIPIISDNSFCNTFLGWSPDYMVSFTLRRGQFGSGDTLVYWKGRVSSHKLKEQLIELSCESIFTSLRRPGMRARYQRQCRHALYNKGCGLNKADFATSAGVTTVSGLTITVPSASLKINGFFTGGIVEFADGSFRLINSHVGSQITISRANRYITDNFSSFGWGKSWGKHYGDFGVTLYPGCDRSLATCLDKFDNILNNGGFKWIPSKNPMSGSSIV